MPILGDARTNKSISDQKTSKSIMNAQQCEVIPTIIYRCFATHSFDTYNLVKSLEAQGFTRGQAVRIMKCIRALCLESMTTMQSQMLSKSDLENGVYLFKAALSELRTEIQILRKNELSALRLETSNIQRELDVLASKMMEDLTALKHEIQLDFNTRKADTREGQKKTAIRIEEMHNKFTIEAGVVRTEIEAVKWETTRRGMIAIFGMGVFALCVMYFLSEKKPDDKTASTETYSNGVFIKNKESQIG